MTRLLPLLLVLGCPTPKEEDDTAAPADTDTDTDTDTDADTDTDTDVDTRTYLPEGFEAALDASGGCSDTWVQAWTTSGIWGMELYRAGILEAARTSGAAVDETLDLAVDDVSAWVTIADPVAINYCTDALSKQKVYNRYDAISGTVLLHMDPPASEYAPGILDVTMTDVVFWTDTGDQVTVPTFTLTDVSVIANWGG